MLLLLFLLFLLARLTPHFFVSMHSSARSALECIVGRGETNDAETGDAKTGDVGTEKQGKLRSFQTLYVYNSTYLQQESH